MSVKGKDIMFTSKIQTILSIYLCLLPRERGKVVLARYSYIIYKVLYGSKGNECFTVIEMWLRFRFATQSLQSEARSHTQEFAIPGSQSWSNATSTFI